MKVIALANQKGGVGKSTLAIHMAVELVRRGRQVAIIDLDPQASVAKWARRREKHQPLVIAGEIQQLPGLLAKLRGDSFDFVLLDLPGHRAPAVNDGIKAADFVVIPARPLDIDIEASGETVATAQRLNKSYALAMSIAPARGGRAEEFIAAIEERGHPVLRAIVTDKLVYPDAVSEGLGIWEYEAKGKAASEIAAFTKAVLERIP